MKDGSMDDNRPAYSRLEPQSPFRLPYHVGMEVFEYSDHALEYLLDAYCVFLFL